MDPCAESVKTACLDSDFACTTRLYSRLYTLSSSLSGEILQTSLSLKQTRNGNNFRPCAVALTGQRRHTLANHPNGDCLLANQLLQECPSIADPSAERPSREVSRSLQLEPSFTLHQQRTRNQIKQQQYSCSYNYYRKFTYAICLLQRLI